MKDLKYIHYFTELLEDANNELVREATDSGKIALGYTCYYIPEVLLNLDNAFSVRLRAPNTGSLDISTYYMSSYLCEYSKAVLERAMEGGYNFLSAICSAESCSEMNRAMENIMLLKPIPNGKFFVSVVDAPFKADENGINHFTKQIRLKMLQPLYEQYGIDISDESIRKSVAQHNEICDIISEISELRKLDNPPITGTEFHILNLVTYTCPKYLIVDKLRETLEEIKQREPDENPKHRARLVVVGNEIDDYGFTELFESCGALIVADRYCFGALPGRQRIELKDDEDALMGVCRYILESSQCARFMSKEKVVGRRTYVKQLVEDFNADGVIYETHKFCEFWGYERSLASYVVQNDFGIPTVTIDRQYTVSGAEGQLRTRIQAFVESLELKHIQKAKGGTANV